MIGRGEFTKRFPQLERYFSILEYDDLPNTFMCFLFMRAIVCRRRDTEELDNPDITATAPL